MIKEVRYLEKLQTDRWRTKREEILIRDSRRCRSCGKPNNLQVHHRQYHINKITNQKVNPWSYSNRYLITLCSSCHSVGHNQFKIPFFKI